MTNGLSSRSETFAPHANQSLPVRSGAPMIIIGFDGSIVDVSSSAASLVFGSRNETAKTNFFSLIHKNHLYPVMRDVADMVCRGKTRAKWLIRLKSANGTWRFFKAEVSRPANGSEQINLILRTI